MAYLKKRAKPNHKTKTYLLRDELLKILPEMRPPSDIPVYKNRDITPEDIEWALEVVSNDLRKAAKRAPQPQHDAFWPLVFVWFVGTLTGYAFCEIHPDAYLSVWDYLIHLTKVIL